MQSNKQEAHGARFDSLEETEESNVIPMRPAFNSADMERILKRAGRTHVPPGCLDGLCSTCLGTGFVQNGAVVCDRYTDKLKRCTCQKGIDLDNEIRREIEERRHRAKG
jgi:hypothetical protein